MTELQQALQHSSGALTNEQAQRPGIADDRHRLRCLGVAREAVFRLVPPPDAPRAQAAGEKRCSCLA